jgi:ATP-dependent Clp protease, protease subunit
MSLRELPQARAPQRPKNFQWDAPSDVLSNWAEQPQAAAEDGDSSTITIYDVIGEDWWTGGGFTLKRASAALRTIGEGRAVTVNINSPGGDMFEGIAIYNLLAAHKGKVTVNVMGLAASAASIIAMAGDDILMGEGAQLMIHNSWGMVVGNRHDLAAASETFAGFDQSLADIYHARTGMKKAEIEKLMDGETFMRPEDAIARGFADGKAAAASGEPAARNQMDPGLMARRQTEAALARAGFSRSDRQQMLAHLGGQRDASLGDTTAARDAGDHDAGVRALINHFKV